MRHSLLCGALLLGLTALAVAAPPDGGVKAIQPPPEPAPVVRLAVKPGARNGTRPSSTRCSPTRST